MEWTMLCGWITTSTRLISTPNNQCASIISRPLLNRVAESIVIFLPMFQVGCFSACSGVIASKSVRGVSRNGPPDAVRMIRRTSETSNAELSDFEIGRSALSVGRFPFPENLPSRHWKIALCSLSTGKTCTPLSRASRMTISPAITRISLLATARSFPASIAASAGRNPPVPTMATNTMSAFVRQAISRNPSSPAKICGSYSSAPRKMSILLSSTRPTACGRTLFAATASFWALLFAASPTISIRSGMSCATFNALSPIDPVAPRTTTRLRFITGSARASRTLFGALAEKFFVLRSECLRRGRRRLHARARALPRIFRYNMHLTAHGSPGAGRKTIAAR